MSVFSRVAVVVCVVLGLGMVLMDGGRMKKNVDCCHQDNELSQNGGPVKASVKVRKSLEVVCTVDGQDDRILGGVENDSPTIFVVARASVGEGWRLHLLGKVRRLTYTVEKGLP